MKYELQIKKINLTSLIVCFCCCCWLSACSPGFVLRAIYEESGILLRRKKIEKYINNPKTPATEREKLQAVLDARKFALEMGLDPKQSFTMYSRVDADVLLWVVAASKKDKFELYTWWFPFAGTIPYKGFFAKKGALKEGKKLKKKGYEIYIRGSDAFSTLGWFNDPVLSTTLKRSIPVIVNTVIHESVHSTVWIKDNVTFNESLANFIGTQGTVEFYRTRKDSMRNDKFLKEALHLKTREFDVAASTVALYDKLNGLYRSDLGYEEKLARRELIFDELTGSLLKKYPELKIYRSINNAEIMQLKFYMTGFPEFKKLYEKAGGNWKIFIRIIKRIADRTKKKAAPDAFKLLQDELKNSSVSG